MQVRAASSMQALQRSPSLWLTSAAADQIFNRSKSRIDVVVPLGVGDSGLVGTSSSSVKAVREALKINSKLSPVLEVPPKWTLLEVMS